MNEGKSISLLESVILGLVQGITEFLPVSSSGHLVILQNLFGMEEPQVLFDVMLHVGTLAAIFVVFRKDINELARAAVGIAVEKRLSDQPGERILAALAVGSVPTALIGVLFSEQFERMFASMAATGIGLIITGLLLMGTFWRGKFGISQEADVSGRITFAQAFLIGTAQGLALTPGISRSGATIALGLLLGLPRELAARFSFLLAVPAIIGALIFEQESIFCGSAASSHTAAAWPIIAGTLVAAVTGIIALRFLLRVVRHGRIFLFAYYCWTLGLLAVTFGIVKN